MTQQITTIQFGNETYKINSKAFAAANDKAQDILDQINELNKDLKEVGEDFEKESGLKASNAIKYFKTRFKDKLKDVKETSEVFEKLTEILDGPASAKAQF